MPSTEPLVARWLEIVVFGLPKNEGFASTLTERMGAWTGGLDSRHFPDGEWYVRVDTNVEDRDVVLVCTLHRPDDDVLPLLLLSGTLRDLGAASIGLVAPYLAYMRQDRAFQVGEGVTSAIFARFLSGLFDWLVTVDPHLHRRRSLAEIYQIPAVAVHAAPEIAAWIRTHVASPLLVGPDAESAQWTTAVAAVAGAPHLVLQKTRRGDRDVEVSVPDVERWRSHTPVLVDDIISTARTMIETVGHLKAAGLLAPVCIGVHAVFADRAYEDLLAAGARVVTCNTIPHQSNAIDVSDSVARAVLDARTRRRPR
jgi:ribose-phosphate pyrophosphokinase